MYMELSEGKHCQQHGAPPPTLPWSAGWISTGLSSVPVTLGLGTVLKISSAGGRPANLAKAQLYQRCSGRGSTPLSLHLPAHGPIPALGEEKGVYTWQRCGAGSSAIPCVVSWMLTCKADRFHQASVTAA